MKYAQYDPTIAPTSPITGWFDSDIRSKPPSTSTKAFFQVTEAQWSARLSDPDGWAIEKNKLVAYKPDLTPAQKARLLITNGLNIKSINTPTLNGTYAVDKNIPFGYDAIQTEAQFVSTFSEFTNENSTLDWQLIDGKTKVTFPTTTDFLNFAKAVGQFYAAASKVMQTGDGVLPESTKTIP